MEVWKYGGVEVKTLFFFDTPIPRYSETQA